MNCDHADVKWRTSRRTKGRYSFRYGKCTECGSPVRRLVPTDSLQRRNRKVVVRAAASASNAGDTMDNLDNHFSNPEDDMSERDKLLKRLDEHDQNPKLWALREEFRDVCEKIAAHELTILRARAADLEIELRQRDLAHRHQRERILRQLRDAEPDLLRDVRTMIERAHKQFLSSPDPEVLPGYGDSELRAWMARGNALTDCLQTVRELWKKPDWREQLAALVESHRDLAELKHVHIPEGTHA